MGERNRLLLEKNKTLKPKYPKSTEQVVYLLASCQITSQEISDGLFLLPFWGGMGP